ncbi:MAG: hypothetical protein AB7D06_16215 [Pedobacter sp.]
MITRLTTLFLVLSLGSPIGALGSVLHRCGVGDSARHACCDQTRLNGQTTSHASGAGEYRCTLSASQEKRSLVTAEYKPQVKTPQEAGILPWTAFNLRSLEIANSIPLPAALHLDASGAPLFTRLCSLLN